MVEVIAQPDGHAGTGLDAPYVAQQGGKSKDLGEIKPSEKTHIKPDDTGMKNPDGDFDHPSAKP